MENIIKNDEINYERLLPEILNEEKIGYKGLLAGGIFSATLAAINPLAFIPGAAFVASYFYKNKFSKVSKSKQCFNGARNIYLNSIDNKVALSIALFYANKAIEYDITNFKAVAMKAFILKALGNTSEMEIVLNTIPSDRVEFNEVKDILTALQLKEPNKIKGMANDVYLTEEEIKKILKEKGFNIPKEFLDSIHKSITHIEKGEVEREEDEKSLSYVSEEKANEDISKEYIENNIDEMIIHKSEKSKGESVIKVEDHEKNEVAIDSKCESNKVEEIDRSIDKQEQELIANSLESENLDKDKNIEVSIAKEDKEIMVFNHIKNLFHENKIPCSLSMSKTSKYCDIMGENRFIRFKFNGKKEYAITPFTVKELKDTNISLQIEVTPKSETGVSRVIFNSLDDLELMNDIIIKCYNKSLT